MKSVILEMRHANWGMIGQDSWKGSRYTLYDDLSVDRIDDYNSTEDNEKKLSYDITQEQYDVIKKNLDLAKTIDTKVEACDGESYEFIEYKDGSVIWKRDLGYIYGIEPLENIVKAISNK